MEHPFLFHICSELATRQSHLYRWAPILLEITFNLAPRSHAVSPLLLWRSAGTIESTLESGGQAASVVIGIYDWTAALYMQADETTAGSKSRLCLCSFLTLFILPLLHTAFGFGRLEFLIISSLTVKVSCAAEETFSSQWCVYSASISQRSEKYEHDFDKSSAFKGSYIYFILTL